MKEPILLLLAAILLANLVACDSEGMRTNVPAPTTSLEFRPVDSAPQESKPMASEAKPTGTGTQTSEDETRLTEPQHTHTYIRTVTEPNCNEKGYTTFVCNCGDTYVTDETDTLGHHWGDWEILVEALCNRKGIVTRACLRCEAREFKNTDPTQVHAYGDDRVCVECGKKIASEGLAFFYDLMFWDYSTVYGIGTCKDAHVVVPEFYMGFPVIKIEPSAFAGCDEIKTIELPYNLGYIDANAFSGCTNLEKVIFHSDIKYITNHCFSGCTSLRSFELPESIVSLDWYAFYGCTGLETIYLPASIEHIGFRAFEDCVALKNIFYNGTIMEWYLVQREDRWDHNTGDYVIYCTDGEIRKD